jgi:hypothetical protein
MKNTLFDYLKVCKRAEKTVKGFKNKIGGSGGVEVRRSRWGGGVDGRRSLRGRWSCGEGGVAEKEELLKS